MSDPAHPFSTPAFAADLYAEYDRLRATSPVLEVDHGIESEFILFRYADVQSVLRESTVSVERRRSERLRRFLEAAPEEVGADPERRSMLVRDDPAHARLRRLVNQDFNRGAVESLAPRIERIANSLLDPLEGKQTFDLVSEYAEPLAAMVIAELLGIDASDQEDFRSWSRALLEGLLGTGDGSSSQVTRARRLMDGYWLELIAEKRSNPGEDLTTVLVEAHGEDAALSDLELMAMLNLVLVAGHETSANLIGSTVWTVFSDTKWTAFAHAAGESEWQKIIDEMLRLESPIQSVARVMTENLEVGGTLIPAKSSLTLVLGSANRDPEMFADPASFDPERENARAHLAFGFGDHFCLGAALARSEVNLALRVLVERLPGLRVSEDEPQWRRSMLLRGLERLPISL